MPHTEYQDHPSSKRLSHALHSTQGSKCINIPKCFLLLRAVGIRGAVAAIDALHLDLGILDYSAILHVEAPDLAQVTGVSRIDSQELRDDSEPAAGVQGSVRQVESLLPQPLWVKVATVFVANALIIVWPSIRGDIAPLQTSDVAGVRGEGSCAAVGLPNIHLTAASAMLFDVRPWLLYSQHGVLCHQWVES